MITSLIIYLVREKSKRKNLHKKQTQYIDCPSIWIDFNKKIEKKYITYVDENVYFSRDQYILNKNYKKTLTQKYFE